MPGFRARELDRSARRDLASASTRYEITYAGLDCLVPSEHLQNPETIDRAVAAITNAIGLAAELKVPRVACSVPSEPDADAIEAIRSAGELNGVQVAAYGTPGALGHGAVPRSSSPDELARELADAVFVRWSWPVPVGGADAQTLVPIVATLGQCQTVDLDLSGVSAVEPELMRAAQSWSEAGGRSDSDD